MTTSNPTGTMARLLKKYPPMSLEEAESGGWKGCGVVLRSQDRSDPLLVEIFRLAPDNFLTLYSGIEEMGLVQYANGDLKPCLLPKEHLR